MRKKTIGEVFQLTRFARGWSLEDIQRKINVQARHLEAIEANAFDEIGDLTYARDFVERYAEVLELDTEVILDAYDTNSLILYYDAGEEPEYGAQFKRSKKTPQKKSPFLPLLYLLLSAVAIFVFVAYIVSTRIQNQVRPNTETSYTVVSTTSSSSSASTSAEENQSTTESSSSDTNTEQEETSSQIQVTGSDANLAVVVSGAEKPVEVVVSVTEATSWISLSDTELANGTTLSPDNQSVTITVPETVTSTTLTLGVVEGVSVKIAGKPVDTSLLTSQTGYITFTIE